MRCIPRIIAAFAVAVFATSTLGADLAKMPDEGPWEVVVQRDVMVPMRDGVSLATDIWLPAKNGKPVSEKLPAVLLRTPYNKETWRPELARFFATHGYVSATQDCRGRYKSGGEFFSFKQEPTDGFDTIEWLARHPACNGKVGMHGVSYMSWVQYEAATQNPPSLAAMIPHCGPINAYKYCQHLGGATLLSSVQWQIEMAMTSKAALREPAIAQKIRTMRHGSDFLTWAARMPWERGKTALALTPEYEDVVFKMFFEHVNYDDFWRAPGFAMDEHLDRFPDVPVLSVVGWYEIYPRSVCDSHAALVARGRKNQFLLCGPWNHANQNPYCGDVNFGDEASKIPGVGSFEKFQVQWFDRWLKGKADARLGEPVKLFIMGGGDGRRGANGRINHGGAWHTGDAWPPRGAKPTRFHLRTSNKITTDAPTDESASTSYTYDPRNTVSSDARCEIAYGPALQGGFTGMGPRDQIQLATLPGHGQPGEPTSNRKDMLVFQSDPLAEDLTLAGNVRAHLFISSDAPDSDFYVKLIDVYPPSADYPAGYALPITDGILRARFRDGFERPQPLENGKIYKLTIAIQPAANLFKAGHRIRLDVSSSSFPNFDINRNTGNPLSHDWRLARNTIHHDREHPSHLEMDVLK